LTPSSVSLSQVLEWTGARLANESSLGDSASQIRVNGLAPLPGSRSDQLAFFFSKFYQHEVPLASPGILITGEPFLGPLEKSGLPLWKKSAVVSCKDPYFAMAILSAKFAELSPSMAHVRFDRTQAPEVHPRAAVDPNAKLGAGVRVGAHVVIEAGAEIGAGTVLYAGCFVGPGCKVGEECVLFPNVVLYENTRVGNRVRIHAGAILGADGFGYAPKVENGRLVAQQKIYHFGGVLIGDDVEIGAATTIDRGTLGNTRVDRGAKLDNNVQIGHNAHLGEGSIMCGCSALAGSSTVGKFCYLAGYVGVGNQVIVGDGVMAGVGAMLASDVLPGQTVMGFPHREARDFYKIQALLNKMLKERKSKVGKG
jgi:UDP-3-O-[3-hydroxymyristoyl] glucosamine N-acyltransferase